MKNLLHIYWVFAQMGAICFGGGYAMLGLLQRVIVEEHGWATEEELMDYYAIGQCTPGVIAVNTSTFIGHKLAGTPGALAASLGFISPSILIITVIAAFLESFASNVIVAHALAGIRVCVCVLILDSVLKLGKKSVKDKLSWTIFLITACLATFTGIPTVAIVVGTGIVGCILYVKGRAKA
ncbi:MAG: chromate transporter [Oscillospiraceae bacterium]|nr:chromate transporter [Oscillospiraceae bacterium]